MKRLRLAADLLAVDVGNSKFEAVLYRSGAAAARWRYVYDQRAPGGRMRRAWAGVLDCAADVPIVLCSVAPARAQQLADAVRRRRGPAPHAVSWRSPWPFRIAVHNPRTLGADRLANVAGLRALGLRDGIAVDCGTAITIDLLRDGVFCGGSILPGFELALAALRQGTAALPAVRLRLPVPWFGVDTASAMQAGVFQVTREGIAGVVAQLRREAGVSLPVVVTGGAGELLGDLHARGVHHVPDLLFLGLRALSVPRSDPRTSP